MSDDEIEGRRTFNLDAKLDSTNYNAKLVRVMKSEEFTIQYVQQSSLAEPIVFYDKTGLGMRIPSENFKVSDVKQCVGSRRTVDVMDVNTQKGLNMSMKEWCSYYEDKDRDRLLNVISLEFSHTRLDNYVECPKLVRDLDWVDCVWPKHLKQCQTESTNVIEKMKYPKVQKYCLMSVAGCYTDFHIDFGGTSVWYHVLHGSKIFWMIPPTEDNINLYEQWVLSGKQGDIFFADQVKECQRIKLEAGYTFIIPTGWIHGVYTPTDSLVFGGNFIHSFNMVKQLQIVDVEDRTHVPQKFRYPFFGEMCWYLLERYVNCIMGKSHMHEAEPPSLGPDTDCEKSPSPPSDIANEGEKVKQKGEIIDRRSSVDYSLEPPELSPPHSPIYEEHSYVSSPVSPRSPMAPNLAEAYVELEPLEDIEKKMREFSEANGSQSDVKREPTPKWIHLTKWELKGLQAVLDRVIDLPINKKCIPKDIVNPDALIRDVKLLLSEHAGDDHKLAATGEVIIAAPEQDQKLIKIKSAFPGSKKPRQKTSGKKSASGLRHRRTRCKACEACTRSDCGECNYCKDMKKFGGPGRMKQTCISRQCMKPMLPHTAVCQVCGLDVPANKEAEGDGGDLLMECGICWEVVHPCCVDNAQLATVNEDLPSSWECPKCCDAGLQGQQKPRAVKGAGKRSESRQPSVDSESSVSSRHTNEDDKTEPKDYDVDSSKPSMPVTTAEESPSNTVKVETPPPVNEKRSKCYEKNEDDDNTRPIRIKKVENDKQANVMKKGDNVKRSKINKALVEEIKTKQTNGKVSMHGKSQNKTQKHANMSSNIEGKTEKSKSSDGHLKLRIKVNAKTVSPVKESPKSASRKRKENGVDVAAVPVKKVKEETPKKEKDLCRKSLRISPAEPSLATSRPKRETGSSEKKHQSPDNSVTSAKRSAKKELKSLKQGKIPKKRGRKPKAKTKIKLEFAISEEIAHTTPLTAESASNPARFIKSGNLKHCPKIAQIKEEPCNSPEKFVPAMKHIVRPLPRPPPPDQVMLEGGQNHVMGRELWLEVFAHLDHAELAHCMQVCKTWYHWCLEKRFWFELDFSHRKITQQKLVGIVRRQPGYLDLSWTNVSFKQLCWLKDRLPQLKSLSLSGCSWASISCLCSVYCPLLQSLDLSWVESVDNRAIKDLLSPPSDHRPGVSESISRLHRLTDLSLSGSDVTDSSFRVITRYLTRLARLNISHCSNITNSTIDILTYPGSHARQMLKRLDISHCHSLTNACVDYFKRFQCIEYIDMRGCDKVNAVCIKKFVQSSKNKFLITEGDKLIQSSQVMRFADIKKQRKMVGHK